MAPKTDIATRAMVVILKFSGKTGPEIAELAGISERQVNRIYAKAKERGFDPASRPLILKDDFLIDAPRSGRPSKQTDDIKEAIATTICRDGNGREKTTANIAAELTSEGFPISSTTIYRVLKKSGLRKTKPTRKPSSAHSTPAATSR
ncbi:hypothetical protein CDD82_352 [Ophiocordyceps australis]|uniref:Transposase Tc1-like domain-containing protein n=1 Tax=Ophiocordyceps australis TaxID=1399860 RepID=A0A2C5ZP44_9HYPO|nr:hypothetical protein CDD82_352 [Ophiocordyceps australis]